MDKGIWAWEPMVTYTMGPSVSSMADRDRDERGRYREQYPPEAFIEALKAEGGQASTSVIADRVGCTQSNAYQKLSGMADAGVVEKRQFGRTVAWTASSEVEA